MAIRVSLRYVVFVAAAD